MARPLRIEYPDAWYHIMNRGRRSETIFADKRDYTGFIELLKDTTEMWNLRITAYCLMPISPAACGTLMAFIPNDTTAITSATDRCFADDSNPS
jgi:hypothetical protein